MKQKKTQKFILLHGVLATSVLLSPMMTTGAQAAGHGEHGTGEHGTGEHGTGEHGHGEHGTGEHGTGEHGTGEHGTGEHGTGEHGTGEHGTGEHGTGEHGAEIEEIIQKMEIHSDKKDTIQALLRNIPAQMTKALSQKYETIQFTDQKGTSDDKNLVIPIQNVEDEDDVKKAMLRDVAVQLFTNVIKDKEKIYEQFKYAVKKDVEDALKNDPEALSFLFVNNEDVNNKDVDKMREDELVKVLGTAFSYMYQSEEDKANLEEFSPSVHQFLTEVEEKEEYWKVEKVPEQAEKIVAKTFDIEAKQDGENIFFIKYPQRNGTFKVKKVFQVAKGIFVSVGREEEKGEAGRITDDTAFKTKEDKQRYLDDVVGLLNKIGSTNVGQKLLKELEVSQPIIKVIKDGEFNLGTVKDALGTYREIHVLIEPAIKDLGNNHFVPIEYRWFKNPMNNKQDAGVALGSAGSIRFNPYMRALYIDGDKFLPPEVTLFHEMVHAYHSLNGVFLYENTMNSRNKHGKEYEQIRFEEFLTTGGDDYRMLKPYLDKEMEKYYSARNNIISVFESLFKQGKMTQNQLEDLKKRANYKLDETINEETFTREIGVEFRGQYVNTNGLYMVFVPKPLESTQDAHVYPNLRVGTEYTFKHLNKLYDTLEINNFDKLSIKNVIEDFAKIESLGTKIQNVVDDANPIDIEYLKEDVEYYTPLNENSLNVLNDLIKREEKETPGENSFLTWLKVLKLSYDTAQKITDATPDEILNQFKQTKKAMDELMKKD